MENESTSTWAFLNKSGEIVNVESDPGSSSESSIEFIHDEIVHYERNNNHRSSLQPEVQKDSQDVVEDSSEVLGFDGTVFEGATVADNVSAVKDEDGGESSRSELILENITSANSNASVSPNSTSPVSPNSTSPVSPNSTSPVSPNSTSPVSPSSSDDSSGSVTLLEGRFSDGDLDTFPEDFWFDSDFELLDQHSSSDLAHLQLAAGVSNTHHPKFNFKLKKQALGTSETESVNASDADDESSNNVELCSSAEESEVAPAAPVDEISPVTNLGSLAPVPPHLPVPTLFLKPPRMSVTFLMLASLVIGLLLGFTTKYSLGPYSSEQLSEDIAEMQRINEMHLLREENEHMRKYVDSLKWRMNNLQNSNKQQLSDELRQVNQLLKGRIDELDQQILAVRHEILEAKSGVQPPMLSDTRNQDLPADVLQDLNEPASDNDPEINSPVGVASHDDIIQIQSSLEELAPEENLGMSFNQGSTDQMSGSGVSLVDIHQNDASIDSDEIIKSENENKADDTIAVLQMKLDEEKRRADNLEKLYAELKQLVDSRKPATDSSALLAGPTVETVQGEKAKKAKESASYCSPLDKDCSASMDWLNRDAMLHLITSVISEIPPQAQQWKEYMAQKFQSLLDPQDQEEPDEELKVEPETNSKFQFKKLNVYMNRMLDQMNRAKEDLQNKFEKTLHKIKKGTSKFWKKTVSKSEKEMNFKKSKERKKDQKLVDIRDSEAKHRSSQDSGLQLTEENNYLDAVDVKKEYKINQKTEEFGQLQKGLEVVEIEQNKHKFDKIKSFRSNEDKRRKDHRSDGSKKHRPYKSNHKEEKQRPPKSDNEDKKHQRKFNDDKKHWPQKSDYKGKKYRPHKSDSEDKKHRYKYDDDDNYQPPKFDDDIKHWSHKSDGDDKKHRPHKSDNNNRKYQTQASDDDDDNYQPPKLDGDIKHWSHKSDGDDKKHRPHKSDNNNRKYQTQASDDDNYQPPKLDGDIKHWSHKSDGDDKKHRPHKSDNNNRKYQTQASDDDDDNYQPPKLDGDIKHWSHKSDGDDKKHRPHKSDNNNRKYQTQASDDDNYQPPKLDGDIKHWSHKSDGDDKKHRPHKSDNNNRKYQTQASDDDDDNYQPPKLDGDIKHWSHKSDGDDKKHRPHKSDNNNRKYQTQASDDDDDNYQPPKLDGDIKHWSHKSDGDDKKHRPHKSDNNNRKYQTQASDDDDDNYQPPKLDGDIKHWSHKSDGDDKKHRPHKSDNNNRKYQTQASDDDDGTKKQAYYKSAKNKKHWPHRSNDKKKHFRKHKSQNNGKRIIDKSVFNAKSASHERNKRKAKEYSDDKKSLKDQKNFQKKVYKKYKNDSEMKAQSKDSCDQLAVKLEDSISTISKQKFRHINSHTILRMSQKLSSFNEQCKHFSSKSVKEWSACQQMWWTLCGLGFLPGQLQNSKCQHYLLAWQMSVAASPDGGGKPGCDDCGCQKKAVGQKDYLDLSKEDRQNATDSDSASGNVKEQKKVMSGEWYFKHKSVPAENKEQDCDENEFECISADLWNVLEDQMLNGGFHCLHDHVHRRRCSDYSNYDIYCYNWFHPKHIGKWASVYYQNFMNFIQNWQKRHF